ncbi:MAG: hypothetical protein RRA35_04845, partial [Desulfomonilia bacterium]|nr:hypothetical protein [Desulfomonilia bacterium]
NSSSLILVASTGRRLLPQVSGTGVIVLSEDLGVDQWYASALIARYQTVFRDSDLILQGGKVYGGYQVGAGFNGAFGPVGLHAEGALFLARGDSSVLILDAGDPSGQYQVDLFENHLAVVLGVNHRFENGLFLNFEYLFNGGGNDDYLFDALLRSALGGSLSLSRQLAGLQASYDFHPRVTGGLSWIYSLLDGSSLACPTLRYSVSDESEFRLGGILAFGKRPSSEQSSFLVPESEFGTYSHSAYFQFLFSF